MNIIEANPFSRQLASFFDVLLSEFNQVKPNQLAKF